MTVARFRKKPEEVEAIQFIEGNTAEVCEYLDSANASYSTIPHPDGPAQDQVFIHTLNGDLRAVDGDWIVKGDGGEPYPVHPDAFASMYDPA